MLYHEIKCDLFAFDSDAYLAHCISSDFAMGAGIAKVFTEKGIKSYLLSNYDKTWNNNGYAIFAPMKGFKGVYNLVTKQRYYMKPTYDTLKEALVDMKSQLPNTCKLAMPCIGAGLDRLEWNKVKDIINDVFEDTYVDITICKL